MLGKLIKRRVPKPSAATAPGSLEQAPVYAGGETLLRHLEWTVLRRLDGLLQGDYRTLLRGIGMDLADLREYQHHDDVRHIDWNVSARQNSPHVRVFTEDREMAAWFVLDLSASVDCGSQAQSKRQMATEFVGVIARLLTRHGNRVGAILYGTGVDQVLPARASRPHVLQLIHAITQHKVQQAAEARQETPGTSTRLHELLQSAAHLVRRRSTVFVVSDFFSEPGWEKPLGQLALRHEVVAVRLLDPMERELPDLGLIPMRDAESGELMLVDTSNPQFRTRFAALSAQRETLLRLSLVQAGVDTLELSTGEDLLGALMRFTELRKRRRQSANPGAQGVLPTHLKVFA